jgi:hypothetical protein
MSISRTELFTTLDGLSLNLCFVTQTLGKTPMHYKSPNRRSKFTSQRRLKFLERNPRQPIPPEDQKRLTSAVQKISNIFGWE